MQEIYVDGSCRGNGTEDAIAGIGIFSRDGQGLPLISLSLRLSDPLTNNEAEYEALILACKLVWGYGSTKEPTIFYCDSKLVVNQVNGKWKTKESRLAVLRDDVRSRLRENWKVVWIPREKNQEANDLAQKSTENKSL